MQIAVLPGNVNKYNKRLSKQPQQQQQQKQPQIQQQQMRRRWLPQLLWPPPKTSTFPASFLPLGLGHCSTNVRSLFLLLLPLLLAVMNCTLANLALAVLHIIIKVSRDNSSTRHTQ
ncbi:hypothetical protein ACLKA7_013064 [Drosophila subpalustris]